MACRVIVLRSCIPYFNHMMFLETNVNNNHNLSTNTISTFYEVNIRMIRAIRVRFIIVSHLHRRYPYL
jgi:hypothetical protein